MTDQHRICVPWCELGEWQHVCKMDGVTPAARTCAQFDDRKLYRGQVLVDAGKAAPVMDYVLSLHGA